MYSPVWLAANRRFQSAGLMDRVSLRIILMLAFLAISVGLDQYSKVYAVEHWKGQPPQIFLADTFRIQYAENPGGFLSLGGTLPEPYRSLMFIVINGGILSIAAGWMIYTIRSSGNWSWWAVGMIVSGGVGNLIDRVRLEGRVIDFMNMGLGSLRTGIFNIADIAISTGVIILVIINFTTPKEETRSEAEQAEQSSVSDETTTNQEPDHSEVAGNEDSNREQHVAKS